MLTTLRPIDNQHLPFTSRIWRIPRSFFRSWLTTLGLVKCYTRFKEAGYVVAPPPPSIYFVLFFSLGELEDIEGGGCSVRPISTREGDA